MKTKNKILTVFLSLLLSISLVQLPVVQVLAADNSADTSSGMPSQWAVEHLNMAFVYKLADQSMFASFEQKVTREELCKIGVVLYEKLSGKQAVSDSTNPFKDTESAEILKAFTMGWIEGISQNMFEPGKTITREDAIGLLYNVIKSCEPKFNFQVDTKLMFKDAASLKGGSLDAVRYTVAKGIIKGKSSTRLGLADGCTRQEILVLAKKTYEYVIQEANRAARGLLYKVSGGKSTVYVLGSVHIADASVYPLDNSIDDAFSKSDFLAVEANIAQDNEGIMYLQKKAVYEGDETIQKHISEETLKLLTDKMNGYGASLEAYNKFKPWYLAMAIQNTDLAQASYSTNLGIDLYLMYKAGNTKQILEVENLKFQVDLFDSFSPELQEQYLLGVLKEGTPDKDGKNLQQEKMDSLLKVWKEGNAAELEKLLSAFETSDPASIEFNKKLLDERNKGMIDKIKSYLTDESAKTYFVVIGAAHLVGDTGIVKGLKDQGYSVEQILD